MMRHFYQKVIVTGLITFFSATAIAQLASNPIFIETIVHNGNYGEAGMDLDGYVTYRVYVQFANPNNYLTSIFATEYIPDCVQDADSSLFIDFPCGLFQHPQGGAYGFQSSCNYSSYPTLLYDSYLTIGKTCQSQTTCDIITPLNQCSNWTNAFEGPVNANYFDGGSFFWDDGAIYNAVCNSPQPTSLGHADANGRVLIGQFTTCGDMNGCINLTYRTQAQLDAGGTDNYSVKYNACFSAQNPCLTNAMDNQPAFTEQNCTGASVVTLDGGGNGPIDYFVYSDAGVLYNSYLNQSTGLSLVSLPTGDYYITMEDELGCRDTTAVFNVVSTGDFSMERTITEPSCYGSCNGTVVYEITGGNPPYSFSAANVSGGIGNMSAMCAGNYIISIEDSQGCVVYEEITVGQPAQISGTPTLTPESCVGNCDGKISLTGVTGGSGSGYAYTLSPNAGACVAPCSGNSVTFESLCTGSYAITISDAGGCTGNVTGLVLAPPPALQIILTPSPVACFGGSNGSVLVSHTGGTGAVTVTPGGFTTPGTATGLAAGTHTFTIEDEGGCTTTGDVVVTEPEQLVLSLTDVKNTKCHGNCNGIVQYAVTGGVTPYTYLLNPQNITGQASSAGAISSLCSGNYTMTVSDLNECVSTAQFSIIEPDELQIIPLLVSPTCTGMFDGSLEILLGGGTGEYEFYINPQTLDITQVDNDTYTINNLGETLLTFEMIDENQCVLLDTLAVVPTIITDMVLTRYSSPETCWNERDGTATMAVQGGHLPIRYQWDDPDNQTTPTATGLASNFTYTVIVTDAIGCTLSDTVQVDPTVGCFLITNAITPNGDGYNDVWVIGGLEYFPDCVVNVYNVWGQNVFSSQGYLTPWNGLFKGEPLPSADYYYVIEYDKTKDPIIGSVTLKY